jgi:ribosome-associated toxin RatA of RatAB toxin-antitoxin module
MTSRHLLRLILLASLCCLEPAAWAAAQPVPRTGFWQQGNTLDVQGSIVIPMPVCEAYAMLTDYERLPRFIPGMEEDRAERMPDGTVRIYQRGRIQVMAFTVQVATVLEMQETPNRRITFRQLEGDLQAYSGEWRFTEVPDGTEVSYEAHMAFKLWVPMQFARTALEREVRDKFIAIGKEAAVRQSQTRLACGAAPPLG